MDINQYLIDQADVIDKALNERLPEESVKPSIIHQAMRYSCLGGGKRLRAILALEACSAVKGCTDNAIDFACAIEMIHAYSLIHDDLPAMDNDDYRRGKLTNHKVYGEGIAVLAGDALLTHAFITLANMSEFIDSSIGIRLIKELSSAIGSCGLIGGQVVDLQSEGKTIELSTLEYIHHNKTGKLFEAAMRGGAFIGQATEVQLKAITNYAQNLGLAFQITDDILDVIGTNEKLGKSIGSDSKHSKPTYVTIMGLSKAKEAAEVCIAKCKQALDHVSLQRDVLDHLASFVLQRDH